MVGRRRKAFALQRALTLQALSHKLAGSAHRLSLLACFFLGRFFVKLPSFHFAEGAFPLHFFLQSAQCLLDIIIADKNLYDGQGLP